MIRDERGVLQIPLMIAMGIIAITGLMTWGILRLWRHHAETQLRLDQCVGHTALELKERLKSIDSSNLIIKGLREAIAAAQASLHPELIPPLQEALEGEVFEQEAVQAKWDFAQASWIARRGCDGKSGDLGIPLPSMQWMRPPPDLLGQRPLVWTGSHPADLRIQLIHLPRAAAARVSERTDTKGDWHAKWTVPFSLSKPGSDLR